MRDDCTHVYYVYPLILDSDMLGIDKKKVIKALSCEGVPGLASNYTNLHLLPMYQKKSHMALRASVEYGGSR